MGLRDIESTLPPGFRFCPSDDELVFHYLYKKVTNSEKVTDATLVVVNLHTCDPSELPDEAKLNENEWYFFSFRERKYSTGFRTNRAAKKGYWKATGKDRTVQEPSRRPLVGMRKTLVFYNGRAPNGVKSGWVMHEFRLENPYEPPKEDWVLCRVFRKTNQVAGETSSYGRRGVQSELITNSTNNISTAGPSSYLNMAAAPSSSFGGDIDHTVVDRVDGQQQQQQLAMTSNSLIDAAWPDAACGTMISSSTTGPQNLAMWQYGFFPPYLTDQQESPDCSLGAAVDGGGEAYKLFLDMGEPED